VATTVTRPVAESPPHLVLFTGLPGSTTLTERVAPALGADPRLGPGDGRPRALRAAARGRPGLHLRERARLGWAKVCQTVTWDGMLVTRSRWVPPADVDLAVSATDDLDATSPGSGSTRPGGRDGAGDARRECEHHSRRGQPVSDAAACLGRTERIDGREGVLGHVRPGLQLLQDAPVSR
jgi:hypothetical protein